MKKNMGNADKFLRILAAIVLIYLAHEVVTETPWNYVLYVFGGIFILTSVFSYCPMYPILGMNTCNKKE